ncbi:MAG: AAA family ATPase [bacterium]
MDKPRWQQEFEDYLKIKNLIIISGNTSDKYLYQPDEEIHSFTSISLMNYLANSIKRILPPPYILSQYDIVNKERIIHSSSDSSDDTITGLADSKLIQDIFGLREAYRRRREKNLSSCYIINWAEKLISNPEKNIYSEEEKKIIVALQNLIEELKKNQYLVFITPCLDYIPNELWENNPKVARIQIPLLERSERATLFEKLLKVQEEDIMKCVNLTENLRFLEIEQLYNVTSFDNDNRLDVADFEKRVYTYKYGQRKNYWAELTWEKLSKAFNYFTADIKGQDEAINAVIKIMEAAKVDIDKVTGGRINAPRGVLFFAGVPGVGKTFVAKKLARFLFDTEEALIQFNMSEYREEHTISTFLGSPPGYVGYKKGGGILVSKLREKPFSVILFDEIEKAHPDILLIFLQILQDGIITDRSGESASFSQAVIIFTSNVGNRQNVVSIKDDAGKIMEEFIEKEKVDKLKREKNQEGIKKHFHQCVVNFFTSEIGRPELLRRIGKQNIIPFNCILDEKVMKDMIQHYLNQVEAHFNKAYKEGILDVDTRLSINADVIPYLLDKYKGEIMEFGGSAAVNSIDQEIRQYLPRVLLRKIYGKNLKKGEIQIFTDSNKKQLLFEVK